MRRLAPACLALAAALLGCSSGSGAGGGGGRAGAADTPAPSGRPAAERQVTYTDRLPIARYSYTHAESALIDSAQQVLTQRCMRTFGIDYEPPKPAGEPPRPADRRYGLSSESEAESFGYRPGPEATPSERPSLPTEALPVFYGKRGAVPDGGEKATYKGKEIPAEGCFGQSVVELSEKYDDPDAAAVASGVATESYEESLTDPSVKEAFRKWSACMRNSEFRYETPMSPLNSSAFQGRTVTAKEKKTAVADVRCKERTGLLDIWFEAESRIQKAGIEKNTVALEKLRTAHQEKTDAARRIVAAG